MKKEKICCLILCLYLMAVGIMGCSAMTADNTETSQSNVLETEFQAEAEDYSKPDTSAIAATELEDAKIEGPGQNVTETETTTSGEMLLPDRKWSPELQAFMEEINDEHRGVKKVEGDYSRYVEQEPKGYLNITPYLRSKEEVSEFCRDAEYSIEQVQEDIDLLMLALQTNYGPYYYFGGREKFLQVKEEIIKECSDAETLNGDFLLNCLLDKLSFIQDGHFSIDGNNLSEYRVPCFYQGLAFERLENGYRPMFGNGGQGKLSKMVESVEGWDNLDDLFKRSLYDDGRIVYYPVVYQQAADVYSNRKGMEHLIKPEDLIVHYSDGSTQTLTADPYGPYEGTNGGEVSYHTNQGVPVIFARVIYNSEPKNDVLGKEFLSYSEKYRNKPVIIVDLRENMGGSLEGAAKWLENYTGQAVTANTVKIIMGLYQDYLKRSLDTNTDFFLSSKTMLETMESQVISDHYYAEFVQPDRFVDNEELLIILTSKKTESAAEAFIDIAHNIANTLVIGENSGGCMFGCSTGKNFELPNTHLISRFGPCFSIFPEDPAYFQEFRGLEPDIWVPAGEAEELAVKFIERYMHE